MEKAKKLLYERKIRTYSLDCITRNKKYWHKNLVEMLIIFPNKGIGLEVKQKKNEWKSFYRIKDVKSSDGRRGLVKAVLYKNTTPVTGRYESIRGIFKRGIWDCRIPQPINVSVNHNSFQIDKLQQLIQEKELFLKERQQKLKQIIENQNNQNQNRDPHNLEEQK
jgi:hypothetical protein